MTMRVKSDPTRPCANPLSEGRNLSGKRQCNPALALTMRNGERGLEVVVAAAAIEGRERGEMMRRRTTRGQSMAPNLDTRY